MKRAYFQGFVFVFLALFFHFSSFSFTANEPSQEVIEAAKEGMEVFIWNSNIKDLSPFGFSSQEEIDKARLGKGFQVYTIPPDRILGEGQSQDLTVMATPSSIWQFLILTEGKAVALLTVDRINSKWTPVSIGASGLASQLSMVMEAWPSHEGYHLKLIRIYQATSDFVGILLDTSVIGNIPLTSGRIAMDLERVDFNPLDLHESSDIIKSIRPIVRENIQSNK